MFYIRIGRGRGGICRLLFAGGNMNLTAVFQVRRKIQGVRVRVARRAARGFQRVVAPRSGREVINSGLLHRARDMNHDCSGGRRRRRSINSGRQNCRAHYSPQAARRAANPPTEHPPRPPRET